MVADEPVPSRRQRRIVLGICCMAIFIISLDNTILNVALPTIQRSLHASFSGLQWVIDAYTVVIASLLLLSGSLGDRFGRRRTFQTGLVVFGIGSLACSLAPNLGTLIAFRMLQAVGGSMLNPNALSIVSNVFTDRRERTAAFGVWSGVFGISAASGPILGGLLVDTIGWRAIFWVNIPVVILAVTLAARYVPESRAARPRRLDPVGQVLIITVLATLTAAIIEGPDRGFSSPLVLALFVVGVVGLAAFVRWELRHHEPLLDVGLFRSPALSGAAVIATLAFLVLAGFLFLNALYLQQVRGESALLSGLATLPLTVVIVVVSPLTGRLVSRRGGRIPLVAAGLFIAAAGVVLTFTRPDSSYLQLVIGYLLLGAGFAMVNVPITNTAIAGMPVAQAGVASAVASTSRQVGSAMGVALMGAVVTSRFHHQLAPRVAALKLPAAARVKLLHSTIGQNTGSTGNAAVRNAVRASFTTASHSGWWLAAGCGVVITVLGWLTTGSWARTRAAAVLSAHYPEGG